MSTPRRHLYDGPYQRAKAMWRPSVEAGLTVCHEVRCLYRTRTIHPGQHWDLAHNRVTGEIRGPAHRRCNRSEAARYGNQLRGIRRRQLIMAYGRGRTST